MKKLILFLILTCISISIFSQNASGIIYFVDGTTQRFYDVNAIKVNFKEKAILETKYQDNYREIPFDKLEKFEIIEWSINEASVIECAEVLVEITTKTGVTFKSPYRSIYSIKVKIHDDLTGGLRDERYLFQLGTNSSTIDPPYQLNIRKIVFD